MAVQIVAVGHPLGGSRHDLDQGVLHSWIAALVLSPVAGGYLAFGLNLSIPHSDA